MGTVAVKKVDEKLYRKLKALAALTGITMGEAVNNALDLWVKLTAGGVSLEKWATLEEEARRDNELYQREESRLLSEHRGEYVSIVDRKILGIFKKLDDAVRATSRTGSKHGIVTRIEEKRRKTVELGWSILEQFA
ncbi:MAG: hypothetical protein HYU03_04300 [Thaumarchaeota archaeon]|nr:hypothetical protein [Nitrososphaerota archaeon]